MIEIAALSPPAAAAVAVLVLVSGAWLAAALDRITLAAVSRRVATRPLVGPIEQLTFRLRQEIASTERPDALLWLAAPAAYAALAATALSVVPLGEHVAIADVRAGIVLFGAAEALAIAAIFTHGWAANSHLSLVGAYRFVALGLSYELLSMFVLIAAALPAESLQVSAIVESQRGAWNVWRQPLGLPLWIVVTMGVTFWGPLNLADSRDLGGGTALEISGRHRIAWEAARGGMLAVFAGMGAAVFLGGWLGPGLPGSLWMLIKTLALMGLVTWLGHWLGRVNAERAVRALWTIGLPLSFVGLALAGIVELL